MFRDPVFVCVVIITLLLGVIAILYWELREMKTEIHLLKSSISSLVEAHTAAHDQIDTLGKIVGGMLSNMRPKEPEKDSSTNTETKNA